MHTPLPWRASEANRALIEAPDFPMDPPLRYSSVGIADCSFCGPWVHKRPPAEQEANAAFIIKAVSSHDELLEIARLIIGTPASATEFIAEIQRRAEVVVKRVAGS